MNGIGCTYYFPSAFLVLLYVHACSPFCVCLCADERHLNLGRRSSCEVNVRGLGGKPLPGNNDRQAKAIQTALTNTLSTIQGPPGNLTCSGFNNKDKNLSPSYRSVDIVLVSSLSRLRDSPQVVRIVSSVQFSPWVCSSFSECVTCLQI